VKMPWIYSLISLAMIHSATKHESKSAWPALSYHRMISWPSSRGARILVRLSFTRTAAASSQAAALRSNAPGGVPGGATICAFSYSEEESHRFTKAFTTSTSFGISLDDGSCHSRRL
jgi:hypothetical protein